MAVTSSRFGHFGEALASAGINYTADTIKVALLANTYVPDLDLHEFFSDVSANEAAGTGYTAGGATLGTKSFTYDSANDRTNALAADTVWDATGGSLPARYAVVYKDTTVATTSRLMVLVDFGADTTATNTTFEIDWNDTNGVFAV